MPELFEQKYCYFDFDYHGHWIELSIGVTTGRVVLSIDEEVVLDETKWTLSHKGEYCCNGEKISVVLTQKFFSGEFVVEVNSTIHDPTQHVYKLSDDPDLGHSFGQYSWLSIIVISLLNVLLISYIYRTQGSNQAIAFGVTFTFLWWLAEYFLLRKRR